jgi:FKBP-type peptidyl-prolyl cis-trans isomerase SlyD
MIEKNKVVSFHYTLTDDSGNTIDTSRIEDREPLTILHGHGSLIPGVEKSLDGRAVGDRFTVSVSPEEGYGVRDESLTQRVPKKYFRDPERLRAGEPGIIQTGQGQQQVMVKKVGSSVVDVDGNHPLAGVTLNFDIEITEIREASAEEIAHGHVHGPGGHHH